MTPAWPGCLTRREVQCADLLCSGLARESVIAAMGGIAYKTYDHYRGAVLRKLGLANTVQLLRFALARGLVEPIDPIAADPITGEQLAAAGAAA